MTAHNQPRLAPPGAGLPGIELLIGRLLLALHCWRGSTDSFNADFNRERRAIRNLYQGLDANKASRRIIIKRVRGLEDSSRNWSVWMTLDHLRIVNHSIARIIKNLAEDIVPEGRASTADVKPAATVDAAIIDQYETSCDTLLNAVASAPYLKTKLRFAHPWFGPLDAFSWHALAGRHMAIHRGQIERIIEGIHSPHERSA